VTVRARSLAALVRDGGLLTLLVVIAVWVLRRGAMGQSSASHTTDVAAAQPAIAALLGRHRFPLGVLAAITALALLEPASGAIALPILLATANVAYRRGAGEIAVAAGLAAAACIGSPALHDAAPITEQMVLLHLAAIGLAIAGGLYLAARTAHLSTLADRAIQLERENLLLAEQAVAEERVRIARELHDVVAHGVSLMVVQTQALGALEGAARDAAERQIAAVGREALTEMHRMLDVLRPPCDDAPELAPAPGVRDVASLVARARSAGMEVALAVEGEPRALPAGVDLSAYRIVQEALTNVIKHARALRAEVRLRYESDALELSVLDDGRAPAAAGPPGHGLLGMRERVALFGGTLEAGHREDAPGYAVRAVLPL
jgi:signal transduction histidine kinase